MQQQQSRTYPFMHPITTHPWVNMDQDKPAAEPGVKIFIKKENESPPHGTGNTHDTRCRKQRNESYTITSPPPISSNHPTPSKQRTSEDNPKLETPKSKRSK